MLLPILVSVALADKNVATFVTDPEYTKAPFAGLERLYVDPATTTAQLKPQAEKPRAESVVDTPGAGSLEFTNPMAQWGELSVNGTKVGTIGPFATAHLAGFAAGWYAVDVNVPTGYARHFAVQVK